MVYLLHLFIFNLCLYLKWTSIESMYLDFLNPFVCLSLMFHFSLFQVYFIDYAITVVPFFYPLYLPLPCTPLPPASHPHLSSCPWVVHISSLASPFPILFLTSPCLFCTYHLCFLISVPFPPAPSPLITLHVISISVNLFLL